jgi:chaperone required for assembly of F1-ATPase
VSGSGQPRRPYQTVSLGEEGSRLRLLLDGKPARTPLRHALETGSRALGEALVAEWDAQGPKLDPKTMPMTRLLATKIDRVAPAREAVIAELLRHLDADVVCYYAETPASLRERQAAVWQPIMMWLRDDLGIALVPTVGIMPHSQAESVRKAMADAIAALDDDRLTAFQAVASTTGSLALALALAHGRLTADEAFAAAAIDEAFQMEQWGADPEARARRDAIARDIAAAEDFLKRAISA